MKSRSILDAYLKLYMRSNYYRQIVETRSTKWNIAVVQEIVTIRPL